MKFRCHLCRYKTQNTRKAVHHLYSQHESSLSCALCPYNTDSWEAFKKHLRRRHEIKSVDNFFRHLSNVVHSDSDDPHQNPNADEHELHDTHNPDPMNSEPEDPDVEQPDPDRGGSSMQNVLAKHLLDLEVTHRVAKCAIDKVACNTQALTQKMLQTIQDELIVNLPVDVDVDVVNNIFARARSTWTDLQTRKKREMFYKNIFKLVAPCQVLLGTEVKETEGGVLYEKRHLAAFVPMAQLLESLLNLPEVWHHYTHSHRNTDPEIMRDLCDGDYVQNHPLTKQGKNWLQIIFSHDDLEMMNALRSNKLHKMSMFYATFANFPPEARSALHNIFVVAIARAKDVKTYGLRRVLDDFISTVKQLQRGLVLAIRGRKKTIYGDLVMVVADTPAAALLGGFKEGVGFAENPCRNCLLSMQAIRTEFVPSNFPNRCLEEYLSQCDTIMDKSLSAEQKKYWSKQFGINSKSVLCEIPNFPVTSNIVQDTMHVLLEGCFPAVTALLVQNWIDLGKITLDDLNTRLQVFPYTYLEKANKPNIIMQRDLDNEYIKQKASVTLTLAYVLPIILSDVCDVAEDEYYRNFVAMAKIVVSAFSSLADTAFPSELEQLMIAFMSKFVSLYPQFPPKPKMHYMLHLPEQIRALGPLRTQNTFRFEGKHGWFKAAGFKNFINLPLSMLDKHQLSLCHRMVEIDGTLSRRFVYGGDEVHQPGGKQVNIADVPHLFAVMQCDEVFETSKLVSKGLEYRPGCCLVLRDRSYRCPKFGRVLRIFANEEQGVYCFYVQNLKTCCYEPSRNAYSVVPADGFTTVRLDTLCNPWPLPMYECRDGSQVITLRHSFHVPGY